MMRAKGAVAAFLLVTVLAASAAVSLADAKPAASSARLERVSASPGSVGRSSAVRPDIRCSKYAAPSGSDRNRGTRLHPFQTAQRLADALRPGETGCLRGGTYVAGSSGGYVLRIERGGTRRAPVVLRSHPGERAILVGIVMVVNGANHLTLDSLRFEGTGGRNSVKIYAGDVALKNSEVTNGGRGASCVTLGSWSDYGQAARTIIRGNRFYDCGDPGHHNKDHAIYISNSVGARILGNVFWNTAGYSIHFYPGARDTRVAFNVIDGGSPSTRGGVLFGGNDEHASRDNVVERNVIAFAETSNITSNWDDGLIGSGNIARRNCLWGGRDGNVDGSDGGFHAAANTVAPPRFANRRRHDYRLQRVSRCRRVVGFDPAARLRTG